MKNLISFYSAFLLIFFSFNLSGQVGLRAGVNLANLSIDPVEDEISPGIKLGFGFGVFYKLNAGDNLTIQPELNFMQHGTKSETEDLGIKSESTFSFNYLQVPVMIKYGFGDMDATNFYIQGGPYLGVGIGKAKIKYCLDGDCEEEEQEYGDGEDGPKRTDFGLQLGAGVNLNSMFSIDARYILGLANLSSDGDVTIKHTGINLSVGYTF